MAKAKKRSTALFEVIKHAKGLDRMGKPIAKPASCWSKWFSGLTSKKIDVSVPPSQGESAVTPSPKAEDAPMGAPVQAAQSKAAPTQPAATMPVVQSQPSIATIPAIISVETT